jgi:predicted nucleic acid-binding protein
MTYLADTSMVVRLRRDREIMPEWVRAVRAGLVAVCPAVEAELVRNLASPRDRDLLREYLVTLFTWRPMPDGVWQDVAQIQDDLLNASQHRGPSVVDLLVAATAQASRLTVLHVDADFDTISRVTGLSTQRADQPAVPGPSTSSFAAMTGAQS